jgi:heme exporter protein A
MLAVIDVSYARSEIDLFEPINFAIQPGQWLHVLGANGVGKTTLLKILAGLFLPTQGRVEWQGVSIASQPDHYAEQRHFIAHELALKTELTVRQNLRYNFFCTVDQPDVNQAICALGLGAYLDRPVHTLSVGLARKLSLIRLLAVPRTLWILDEILSALDTAAVTWVQAMLLAHCNRGGMAIVTSHHALPSPASSQVELQEIKL